MEKMDKNIDLMGESRFRNQGEGGGLGSDPIYQ